MHTEPCTTSGGIYRPRKPRASPLYQCVRRHYDELEVGGHFTRPVEEEVLTRFLDCGDLQQGFARVYCDGCGHDYLLAFSCKARYFCPNCHQKRMLAYGEWVEEHVLAPVPHRQYVLSLPKLLLAYIPDKYEHLVRNSGWYSNRARGERNTETAATDSATTLHLDETSRDRTTRANWARLIRKVYEVNPLGCPKCSTTMRIIAVIDDTAVIRKILKHLHRWNPNPKEPDHPARDPPWPSNTTIPLTYHPGPDSA